MRSLAVNTNLQNHNAVTDRCPGSHPIEIASIEQRVGASDEDKAKAAKLILKRMGYLADTMEADFLFGANISAADCYLFVMLLWAKKNALAVTTKLAAFGDRMMARPAVQKAMTHTRGLSRRASLVVAEPGHKSED